MGGQMPILWIIAGAGLLGAIFLVVACRGRRVGDHPFCRKCGFDLFGLPERSRACPECGGDLAARRATVVGMRRPRPGVAGAGVTLMLPALGLAALLAWGTYKGVDWQKKKPTWWLIRETDSSVVATRNAALAQLVIRHAKGQLAPQEVERLVVRALDVQADADRPWDPAWGRIVERARAGGQVTDGQWAKFAGQSVSVDFIRLQVRKRVRRGDPLPHGFRTNMPRAGGGGWERVARVAGFGIGGEERKVNLALGHGFPDSGGLMPGVQEVLQRLPDGVHEGYLLFDLMVAPPTFRAGPVPVPPARIANNPKASTAWWMGQEAESEAQLRQAAIAKVQLRVPFTIELLPADRPSVVAVGDESHRARVEKALTIDAFERRGKRLTLMVTCYSSPVDLCYRVLLRQGEKEWEMGTIAFDNAGHKSFAKDLPANRMPAAAQGVDVIFRPDPAVGAPTLDLFSYWNHEVIIKDVPMRVWE